MTINVRHIDPALKQELDTVEHRDGTIAEYFFPDTTWRTAILDPAYTKVEDIREYNGMTPQFSQGKRLIFADAEVRDLVYPQKSDGAAYGSLLFTPCREFHEMRAKVLIIDDTTGATAKTPDLDIMPRDEAMMLVGDCAGKMDRDFAEAYLQSSRQPIQFRMGIKPQEGNEVFRIAKGTLAPADLSHITSQIAAGGKAEYDIILPTSAFKGLKGETAIEPGTYDLTVGLGVKVYAEYGPHRLGTQVLVNYPKGVEADILPLVEDGARHLADIQALPYKVADEYIRSHERRKALSDISRDGGDNLPDDLEDMLLDALGDAAPEREDPIVYQLLKRDLDHFGQILDHPLIIDELKKHERREWQDLALGRGVSFHSGMAQPSLRLQENEVCVPFLPDGEDLIVLRSPVLNSNGVVILKNRHIPEAQELTGTIHINPKAAAYHMQADFDGDRLAFDLASKYPTLASEIRESHSPENRYPDVVKPNKVPYQDLPFEEIALAASSDKVGMIANRIQKAIALSWETTLLPDEAKEGYVKEAAQYYRTLLTSNSRNIPSYYVTDIVKLANLQTNNLSEPQIKDALQTLRSIERRVVGELSVELQVAVDGFKSSLRPNETVLKECQLVSNYRPVSWINEKSICKRAPVEERPFFDREMESTNYSPIDLLIKKVDEYWKSSPLEPAHSRKFQKIFEPLSPTAPGASEYLEVASQVLNEERTLTQRAIHLRNRLNADSDFRRHTAAIHFPDAPGQGVYVTNIQHFAGLDSQIWNHPNVSVTFERTKERPELLAVATAELPGGDTQSVVLGTVSKVSLKEHGSYLESSPVLERPKITISSGITEERIKHFFDEAERYRDIVRTETRPEDRKDLQRALWQCAFTKTENQYKKGRAAFTIFPEEVLEKLTEFHGVRLQASGLQYETNEHRDRKFDHELVTIEVDQAPSLTKGRHRDRIILVDGDRLGTFSADSLPLQPGTKARAEITTDPPTAVMIAMEDGRTLKATQVAQYAFPDALWNGETKAVSVSFPPELRGKALAMIDRKPLGVLDKDSLKTLGQAGVLTLKKRSFPTRLESPAPSTATIEIQENTLVRPWEGDRLRLEYEKLAEFVVSHPDLEVRTRGDVDRAIAAVLASQHADPRQIQLVLAQSDTIRDWKRSLPYGEFRENAKEYLTAVTREARNAEYAPTRSMERGMER